MNRTNVSDTALWEEVVSDNTRAFAVLYARHWKKLYSSAFHFLKDRELAEQIVHDAFVALWQRRKHLKIENFNGYIYITTKYHVFKHLSAAKGIRSEPVEEYESLLTIKSAAEDKLDYEDLEYNLKKCLASLPAACRRIFLMSRLEQLSNEEIALKLGITKRTVENQITHALKHLRLSRGEIVLVAILLSLR
ncbi:RNA polymerase sigma factor [Arcticibacter sp. MXS-1]|uniref:RNA polymerase sigma factor n=1 Tax=Arcticibacter sp. MXS-1 TaxID=3341726 RepID=UPI0035A9A063